MEDYEKLGVFYLGQAYDLSQKKATGELILYDSKDLVTHAICVGMTGSGKTGLCISLIEEAAIDGVPSILIDPKGDLTNLLLTFPQLRAEDFLPWINADDAAQKGLSPQEYAAQQAELWKDGLTKWGQSGERIARLRQAADFRIYTPGSSAGLPVSIMQSFAAPDQPILADSELLRDRITTTVDSLLSLAGIQADPVQSREHILLSTLFERAWRAGQNLDLATLIQQVQAPPITRVGVLDLESFYPAKERFGLVMALNNLLASPGFSAWLEGEPLDIGRILYTPQGKPRVAIFAIAHLGDAERMFFVSLLMNQILGWMRSQSGTTSLRAIVYMDEIFGYLPPMGNPPAKLPILTLLKQARAFGIGLVLATQNPVDLDYKALSNAGTWFVGRLQTERDKARLLDGLEGVAAGSSFDRSEMDKIISALGSRVFLMNNTHEDAPVVFQTRWALSYLRGPLTRDQIKTLMDPLRAALPVSQPEEVGGQPAFAPATAPATPPASGAAPTLPPDVRAFYLPIRGRAPAGASLTYLPYLVGAASVRFSDAKNRIDEEQNLVFLTPITDEAIAVDWERAAAVEVDPNDFRKTGEAGAGHAPLPVAAAQARNYAAWERDFAAWLYRNQSLELLSCPSLKLISKPGENERDFRIRLGQAARETRDAVVETLRKKYAPRFSALQERKRRAEAAVQREKEQAAQQKAQAAISIGATLLSAFTGRKLAARSTLGRATTAVRGVSRSMGASGDVNRAEDTVESIDQQIKDLQAQFDQESAALASRLDPATEPLETITIRPKKADINVRLVALAWAPVWRDAQGGQTPAY